MTQFFISICLCFASVAALAVERPATAVEVKALCQAIDQELSGQQSSMAIDMEKCLKSKMRTIQDAEGVSILGPTHFKSPNKTSNGRAARKMLCTGVLAEDGVVPTTISCSL